MPHLEWSRRANLDITRLYQFLEPKSRSAALRAVRAIQKQVRTLAEHPEIGRPASGISKEFREYVVPFGKGAYIVRYRYDNDKLVILRVRHNREAGY